MRTKFLLLSCVLLWSCAEKNEIPNNIFNQEEMVDILLEVYVAQAKVSVERGLKRDSSEILYEYYQNYIFQKREIDSTDFYNSLTYYFEHPVEFEKINEIVLDSLNLRLEKMEAQEEKDNKGKKELSNSIPK
ncbi:MAG: DUF4296 domain-containing protein [Cyclobacteriaceae bacterium]|nr:DUF4296 domain-containing protein [Cyclobacteriaceae bacterium]